MNARMSARLMSEPDVYLDFHLEQSFHSAYGGAGNFSLLRASCPSPLRGQLRCSRRSCGAVPVQRKVTKRKHVTCVPGGAARKLRKPAQKAFTCSSINSGRIQSFFSCVAPVLLDGGAPSSVGLLDRKFRACAVLQSRPSWGATQRAFFLGDFFLYTSKERSYPLLRSRSGSSRKGSGSFASNCQNPAIAGTVSERLRHV